jgi:DNA-binding NarL/FixJ family response regulator
MIRAVVIDDHEMVLQSLVLLLGADDTIDVVGTATTGKRGIEVCRELLPDVLVVDFHLADMNAPEVIGRIRSFDPHVKVVTISGSDRPSAWYAAMRAGSVAWVRKTQSIQDLRDAIVRAASDESRVKSDLELLPCLDELLSTINRTLPWMTVMSWESRRSCVGRIPNAVCSFQTHSTV